MECSFYIPGLYFGLVEVEGILSLDPSGLSIEYQLQARLLRFPFARGKVKSLHLPIEEIRSADFQTKRTQPTLLLRTRTLSTIQHLPRSRGSAVRLFFDKQDREAGHTLATTLAEAIADRNLLEWSEKPLLRRME